MTMKELEKMTVGFAVDTLKLSNFLIDKEMDSLADWLFHSGTQIGVHVARAKAASTAEDFISEMNEAFSQANKALYWIDIIYENELTDRIRYETVKYRCNRIRIEISKAIRKAETVK